MTKRPNKLGRIEGEPKVRWYKKTNWSVIGKTVLVVGLVALGVLGTLQYLATSVQLNKLSKGAKK